MTLAACGSDEAATVQPGSAPTGRDALPSLRREANELLGGGAQAFGARLAGLRGHPVVVNQWASWCGPCRFEFPFFAALADRYRGRAAFLGVDAQDARPAALRFLREKPLPYPSFFDPSTAVARLFPGGLAWPTTAFYDARGKVVYTHAGAYASQAKLEEEIRRYALGGA
ncbi:MAG: TlpA family protein disulfide reductase [Solirubrobacteraceae bacterium]